MRFARTPEEIQMSIVVNRAELARSVERLRGEVAGLRAWPPMVFAARARRPAAVLAACSFSAWLWRRRARRVADRFGG
jgi:hypothetical protein